MVSPRTGRDDDIHNQSPPFADVNFFTSNLALREAVAGKGMGPLASWRPSASSRAPWGARSGGASPTSTRRGSAATTRKGAASIMLSSNPLITASGMRARGFVGTRVPRCARSWFRIA